MARFDLSDEEWVVIEPLLPIQGRGDARKVLIGIFYILRTGAPSRRNYVSPVRQCMARFAGQILGLLGESDIAKNLRELSRYAREGSRLLDDVTQQQIVEAYKAVIVMRTHLISALGLNEASHE